MNWKNLKQNKCPNCENVYLSRAPFSSTANYYCQNCTFKISPEKFNKIVGDMYRPKERQKTEEENLSDLNNMGHDIVAEDFSDNN